MTNSVKTLAVFCATMVLLTSAIIPSAKAARKPDVTWNLTTRFGDVNLDGRVNTSDATVVIRACCGLDELSEEQRDNSDVNLDGKVNSADALVIIKYAIEIIDSLPLLNDSVVNSIRFSNNTLPSNKMRVSFGRSYIMGGLVVADAPLLNVRAIITDVETQTVEIDRSIKFSSLQGVNTYDLHNSYPSLDSIVKFSELSTGEKQLRLLCSSTKETNATIFSGNFVVGFMYSELRNHVYNRGDVTDVVETYRVLSMLNGMEVSASKKGSAAVSKAISNLGKAYSEMDCSMFVKKSYASAGVDLPRTAADQALYCHENSFEISKEQLKPGDLIFMSRNDCDCGRYNEIHHVAMYLGTTEGITYIAESSSGLGEVVIRRLWGENGTSWSIVSYARPYSDSK